MGIKPAPGSWGTESSRGQTLCDTYGREARINLLYVSI